MPSTLADAQTAILTALNTGWGDETPVAWPNVNFTPPEPVGDAAWLQVAVLWGDGFPGTMGESGVGMNDVVGLLHLNIFTVKGRAGARMMALVDKARDIVNRLEIDGVRFGAAAGPAPQPEPDTAWMQAALTVPFTVEETL